MKVIFLDIDGVLNSNGFLNENGSELIDRKNVRFLKEIIERTGAIIILSSGWRFRFDDDMKPCTEEAYCLHDILREFGIKLYGKTPDHCTEEIKESRSFSKVKAKEIKAWIDAHKDIESYIVLDDLGLNDEEIDLQTIRIDNMAGLTEDDVNIAIGMLIN